MSAREPEAGKASFDREALVPALKEFVGQLVRGGQFDLRARIEAPVAPAAEDVEHPEIVVDFSGRDAELLVERHGELLQAIEHITLRCLRLDPRDYDRIRFDCEGYRAGRIAELQLAAAAAAERVRQTRSPYRFNPMESRERRVLHLALKNAPGVRSASEGEGENRAVVIYPA
ncbi:MAG: protein jag [Candidatus Acidiferrales bacterium]